MISMAERDKRIWPKRGFASEQIGPIGQKIRYALRPAALAA
jgi:hypothetical protein